MQLSDIQKQKRNHRRNVNLTQDEDQMFGLIAKLTGEHKATILRNMAMAGALHYLNSDEDQYSLDQLLSKGAEEHLERS